VSHGTRIPKQASPGGAKPLSGVVSSFAALRLSRWPQPAPTADAVGYRSFAALRLSLMPLKTSYSIRVSQSLTHSCFHFAVGSMLSCPPELSLHRIMLFSNHSAATIV
jgi:hypothetical protein